MVRSLVKSMGSTLTDRQSVYHVAVVTQARATIRSRLSPRDYSWRMRSAGVLKSRRASRRRRNRVAVLAVLATAAGVLAMSPAEGGVAVSLIARGSVNQVQVSGAAPGATLVLQQGANV